MANGLLTPYAGLFFEGSNYAFLETQGPVLIGTIVRGRRSGFRSRQSYAQSSLVLKIVSGGESKGIVGAPIAQAIRSADRDWFNLREIATAEVSVGLHSNLRF
jgi:hypothetical protein